VLPESPVAGTSEPPLLSQARSEEHTLHALGAHLFSLPGLFHPENTCALTFKAFLLPEIRIRFRIRSFRAILHRTQPILMASKGFPLWKAILPSRNSLKPVPSWRFPL
jgi:hypothetical protein